MSSILGRKLAMTAIFDPVSGRQTPCTIVEAGPCVVTQVREVEKDGYHALQIAYLDKKEKHCNQAEKGHFAKAATAPKRHICEVAPFAEEKKVGDILNSALFSEGDKVAVVGISKGKGFQGVVKRHGFRGVGESSHGQHDRQRAPGSVGGSSFPSRVFKGLRMAGRMGAVRVKVKGLRVLKVLPEKNYLLIKGAIPGHKGGVVLVQK